MHKSYHDLIYSKFKLVISELPYTCVYVTLITSFKNVNSPFYFKVVNQKIAMWNISWSILNIKNKFFPIKFYIYPYLMKNKRRGRKLSLQTYLFFTQNTTQHTIDNKSRFLQQVEKFMNLIVHRWLFCRLYPRWW